MQKSEPGSSLSVPAGFVCVGALCLLFKEFFDFSPWLNVSAVAFALVGLTRLISAVIAQRNRVAAAGVLNDVDVIQNGLRIIGRNLEVVVQYRDDDQYVQICKTPSENWIEHRFQVSLGSVFANSFRFMELEEARARLSYNVALYEKVFGAAAIA